MRSPIRQRTLGSSKRLSRPRGGKESIHAISSAWLFRAGVV
jgi:hypothetical protein